MDISTSSVKETLETDSAFSDSVLKDSDLSLLEILRSLQNSGSISEVLNLCALTTSTTGLLNTPNSTTSEEDIQEALMMVFLLRLRRTW